MKHQTKTNDHTSWLQERQLGYIVQDTSWVSAIEIFKPIIYFLKLKRQKTINFWTFVSVSPKDYEMQNKQKGQQAPEALWTHSRPSGVFAFTLQFPQGFSNINLRRNPGKKARVHADVNEAETFS